jgi:hypothetical protein
MKYLKTYESKESEEKIKYKEKLFWLLKSTQPYFSAGLWKLNMHQDVINVYEADVYQNFKYIYICFDPDETHMTDIWGWMSFEEHSYNWFKEKNYKYMGKLNVTKKDIEEYNIVKDVNKYNL